MYIDYLLYSGTKNQNAPRSSVLGCMRSML